MYICVYTYTCACVCVRACVRVCVCVRACMRACVRAKRALTAADLNSKPHALQPLRILVQYGAVSGAPARVRRDTPRQVLATLAMVSAALAVCCALIASSDLRANKTSLMQVRAVGGTRAKSRARTHAHVIRLQALEEEALCKLSRVENCRQMHAPALQLSRLIDQSLARFLLSPSLPRSIALSLSLSLDFSLHLSFSLFHTRALARTPLRALSSARSLSLFLRLSFSLFLLLSSYIYMSIIIYIHI